MNCDVCATNCMGSLRLPLHLMNITSLVFSPWQSKRGSKTILASFMPLIHSYHRLHQFLSTVPLLISLLRACEFRCRTNETLSLDEDNQGAAKTQSQRPHSALTKAYPRSICGGQWMVHSRHILAWRSTFAGRLRERQE